MRWLIAALLPVEVAIIAALFDSAYLVEAFPSWWTQLMSSGGAVAPLVIAIGASLLLFGAAAERHADAPAADARMPGRARSLLFVHLAAFAGFFALTEVVFGPRLPTSSAPVLWALAWGGAGLVVGLSWGAMVIPRQSALRTLRHGGPALVAALVVGVLAWSAGRVTEGWWKPLQGLTWWATQALLERISGEVFSDPAAFVLGIAPFIVYIGRECSGYQGIGLSWVFLTVYLWLFRGELRFPRAVLLIPLATVAAWLANVLRLTILIFIGAYWSPDLALGGFHAYSGSILFCVVSLSVAWAAHGSQFFSRRARDLATSRAEYEAAPFLLPLLVILAASMVGGALSLDVDWLYPLRVGASLWVLWAYRRFYAQFRASWSWPACLVGAGVFVAWVVTDQAPVPSGEVDPISRALAAGDETTLLVVLWLAIRAVGAICTVPIAEELAFRGYLMRRLIAPDFRAVPLGTFSWLSFTVTSLLFGVTHERWIVATLAGGAYGLTLYNRRQLADPIQAHMVTNALLVVHALLTGRTDLLW